MEQQKFSRKEVELLKKAMIVTKNRNFAQYASKQNLKMYALLLGLQLSLYHHTHLIKAG